MIHKPVLLTEVIQALQPRSGGVYIDGTVGAGGHAAAILQASAPDSQLFGLDQDGLASLLCANENNISEMFTHEMAKLVLLEQLYRAFTIIKGKTYHY